MLYPVRLSHRLDGEIKRFTKKQKLREFNTTRPALQQMIKELLCRGRGGETRNLKQPCTLYRLLYQNLMVNNKAKNYNRYTQEKERATQA